MNCAYKHCTITCNVKHVAYINKINFEVLLTPWLKPSLWRLLSLKLSEISCFLHHPKAHFVFIGDDKSEALFNVPFDVELLDNHPIPKLETNPLSTVWNCMLNIYAATVHIWRSFPQFVGWTHAWPLWNGTHVMWKKIYVCFKMHMFLRCGAFLNFGYWRKTLWQ